MRPHIRPFAFARIELESDAGYVSVWHDLHFFETTYGEPVASALQKPLWPALKSFPIQDDVMAAGMPWLTEDLSPWMTRVPRKLLLSRLKLCLQLMHLSS